MTPPPRTAREELMRWLAADFFDGKIPPGYTERVDAALAEATAEERARPRWHHSPWMEPDDPHFCEDCDRLHHKAQAAAPDALREALERLIYDAAGYSPREDHDGDCEIRTAKAGWKQGEPPVIQCVCGRVELDAAIEQARAVLAAPAVPAAIDPDRLARALHAELRNPEWLRWLRDGNEAPDPRGGWCHCTNHAAAIAAAYAADGAAGEGEG